MTTKTTVYTLCRGEERFFFMPNYRAISMHMEVGYLRGYQDEPHYFLLDLPSELADVISGEGYNPNPLNPYQFTNGIFHPFSFSSAREIWNLLVAQGFVRKD